MTITDIYAKYKIMPNLQTHMLRVAAVAKLISDNMTTPLDEENVAWAALLHDMGNILKFKLTLYPELLEPEGLEYWQQVQEEYRTQYGDDEHDATIRIAQELGVSGRVLALLNAVGFSKAKEDASSSDLGKKICCYADQRVAINGVVGLESRLADSRSRYSENKGDAAAAKREAMFEEGASALTTIEAAIFAANTITPQDVNDDAINDILQSGYLQKLELPV